MATDLNYPPAGVANPNWRDPVANVAALPTINNNVGDVRLAQATNALYWWNGVAWIATAGGGGGGSVNSVTGLNTDNTDPANPVVQISVDGTTITGDGTPGNPLVSSGGSPLTGTPTEVVYFDGSGNPTSDAGLTNDGVAGLFRVAKDDGAGNTNELVVSPTVTDNTIADGTNTLTKSDQASITRYIIGDGTDSLDIRRTPGAERKIGTDGTSTTTKTFSGSGYETSSTDGSVTGTTTTTPSDVKQVVTNSGGFDSGLRSDPDFANLYHHDGVDQTIIRMPTTPPNAVDDVMAIDSVVAPGLYQAQWKPQAGSFSGIDVFFGDGFDGAFVLDGTNTYASVMSKSGSTYTLLRSIFATTFQVDSGVTLNTAGYGVWASTSMTVDGTVGSVGNNAANPIAPVATYGSAGAGGQTLSSSSFRDAILIPQPATSTASIGTLNVGGNGGIGCTGSTGWGLAGQSVAVNHFLLGGIGGAGGRGYTAVGTLGPASTVTYASGFKFVPYSMFNAGFSNHIGARSYISDTTGMAAFVGCPGSGGGAGVNLGGSWGGVGGSGGSSPFGVKILAKTLTIGSSGVIRSNGGNGSAGTAGTGGNWIAGAGGGGAGGGIVHLTYATISYTPANNIQALGGTGGAGGGLGAGAGSATAANAGANGSDGYVHLLNVTTGVCSATAGQY